MMLMKPCVPPSLSNPTWKPFRTPLAARRRSEQAFRDPGGVGFAWNVLLGFLRLATMRTG